MFYMLKKDYYIIDLILADVQGQNIVVHLVVAYHLDSIFIIYGTTGKLNYYNNSTFI